MKIAIIGRTKMLLDTAIKIAECGHEIPLIITSKESSFYEASAGDFESFANKVGAKFLNTSKANNHIDLLRSIGCDLGVSMNCTSILSNDFLNLFKYGVFNAHPGDLPRYRGNACPNWAILNGENEIKLTVHKMNSFLDDGPIALKSSFPLGADKDVEDFYIWMKNEIPSLFINLINKVEDNNLDLIDQATSGKKSLRCYPRSPEDGLIDWHSSAEAINRLIKASTRPFEGAYTHWRNEKICIWKAEVHNYEEDFLATPGQLLFLDKGFPVVATGDGVLIIKEFSSESDELIKDFGKNLRNRFSLPI